MEYSKWTKQTSGPLPVIILAIMTFIVIVVATLLGSRGQSLNWLTQLLVTVLAIGGIVLAYTLPKRNANMMSRVLRMEYESLEFTLRKVFKDKNIRFYRQEDETRHPFFEFPGTPLTATIRPYDPIDGSSGLPGKLSSIGMPLSATLVTLRGLNSKNRELVEMLAEAIDGIEILVPIHR